MNKFTVRDFIFTLSGYMSLAFEFIKAKYKVVLPILGLDILLVIPSFFYIRYNQNLMIQASTADIKTVISSYLWMTVWAILYSIIGFILQAFISGILYTQCRAYVDRCEFSFKDSLNYSWKRLGSYTTTLLAQILIYAGIIIAFSIVISFFVGMFAIGMAGGMGSNSGNMIMIILMILIYIGLLVLLILLSLRLFFSFYTALNYKCGGFHSLGYSNELTKGFKGKLFGYLMLFAAVGLGLSIIIGMLNVVLNISNSTLANFSNIAAMSDNIWSTLLSSILSSVIAIFTLIFYSFTFINIDSVKRRFPLPNSQLNTTWEDAFYAYCLENQIQTEYVPPNEPNQL